MPEAIHQEILFDANPSTIYDALTDSTKFGEVTSGSPTEINKESGGSFSLFGGMIAGRNLELVQNKRIVQAWRAANWEEGVYSVVKIELNEQGTPNPFSFGSYRISRGTSRASFDRMGRKLLETPQEILFSKCLIFSNPTVPEYKIQFYQTGLRFPSV